MLPTLSLGDWLLVLAGAFLFAHVLMDVRSVCRSVRHPEDLAWTVTTLTILVGHLIMDYIGR